MRGRIALTVGLAIGAVLGAGRWALASIPDASKIVNACYQNGTNATKPVKLLNTSQKAACPSGWSPVAWNQKGQPGTALAYAHVSGTSGAVSDALNVTTSDVSRVDIGNNIAEFCFNLPFTAHNVQAT